ncbi:hypothetical protein [Leptolyngbya sp. BC1307]|uniref:hypothetical protein n=1 Tax=Leptolyngbya sp. BC1307 TaxID=2029589 RepID=UPI000EFB9E22|nr:hypothetical protein [Leptolyngbya sp. BC1307]
MNQREIEHRDRVLRTYFDGRTWDANSEYTLKRQLIRNSHQLLPEHPYVIEEEWEVEPGRTDQGRGDLVFTDGDNCFAIVEVKWIDLSGLGRKGSTRSVSNRKKRRKVEEQAVTYARLYASSANLTPDKKVEAFVFTNEFDRPHLIA